PAAQPFGPGRRFLRWHPPADRRARFHGQHGGRHFRFARRPAGAGEPCRNAGTASEHGRSGSRRRHHILRNLDRPGLALRPALSVSKRAFSEGKMKVIVLGAGIIGTTSAYQLAKAGHEVVVIDRQPGPALETSFANAGEVSFGY